MFSQWKCIGILICAAGVAAGQPALTTIRDILYRADGTRYSGTLSIKWSSFQAGDASNIATADLTVQIVNGSLNVQLVPTTTGSAGAQYDITYNSQGKNQFTEVWAVPPSAVPLRVRDVRVSSGTIIGPPPVITSIQISDVVGLENALAVLTDRGVGFTPERAAVINSSSQIDGASGNLGDCVHVDGSSGPCGSGGSGAGVLTLFSDSEIPAGTVNGVNAAFTLNLTPSPATSLELYRNGLRMRPGVDFSLSGNVVTFFFGSTPQAGDLLLANYRYADPTNPLSSLAAAQVICSTAGATTSATLLTPLGSCTIPAGLLGTGDRIEVEFQYSHAGSTTGFTGQIQWGGTTFLSRSAVAAETGLSGHATFGINTGGQTFDVLSWGNSLALSNVLGSAAVNTAQSVTLSFSGQMAGSTADSVILHNFTVIRYPAQSNP